MGQGNFDERVGENPQSHGHFGASGPFVSFFVSEIRTFKDALWVQIKFPLQNLWSGKLKISTSHSNGA